MISRSKIIVCSLFLTINSALYGQSLDSFIKIASENNPELKARYAEFEAALQRVTQVNSLPNPTLSFGYFISAVETRVGPQQAKFGLSQMFPWFGTLEAKEEMATHLAEAKYQEVLNARNELYFKVKFAWYQLYEVNKLLIWEKENREILKTYKQISTTSFRTGKGSMVDVIRVDILIENANTEIELLEDKKRPLIINFNRLLNRADTTSVKLVDSLSIITVADFYRKDSLLIANPMLKAYGLEHQSALAKEEIARKQAMPQFGLGIDYIIVGERTDAVVPGNGKNAMMPMVSMSLPIFRKTNKAEISEAQMVQSSISYNRDNFENNLVSTYEMTWYELESAKKLVELYRTQISKTEQVISLLLVAYSNSGKEFEEVLRMQQEILKYKMAKTTALKAYFIALAKLDYITAKP